MPPRIPPSFKPRWNECLEQKAAAIAEAKAEREAKKAAKEAARNQPVAGMPAWNDYLARGKTLPFYLPKAPPMPYPAVKPKRKTFKPKLRALVEVNPEITPSKSSSSSIYTPPEITPSKSSSSSISTPKKKSPSPKKASPKPQRK
jgi:hypothetical protein